MKKQFRQIVVGGMIGAVATSAMLGSRVSAAEIIDEKGDKWTDITEVIGKWPLNSFNAMYISEYDSDDNSLSVILNGVKTNLETGENVGWRANEVMLAWQNYSGVFQRNEFGGLGFDELGDKYSLLSYYRFNEPLDSGIEVKIDADRLIGRWMDYFYEKRLAYVMRSDGGDATRATTNSAFACVAELQEGQVCRLYYREPLPGASVSSGLMKYFPVQRRELGVKGIIEDEAGNGNKKETGVDETMAMDPDAKNESDDIEHEDKNDFVLKNDGKYSSGDIFDDDLISDTSMNGGETSGAISSESKYIRYELKRSVVNNPGAIVSDPVDVVSVNMDSDTDQSHTMELISAAERLNSEDDAEKREEEIEVPRLGVVARRIDYKWLLIPVLGLFLVIYWWFIVPIWRKRQKNAKKSKKSVDNT